VTGRLPPPIEKVFLGRYCWLRCIYLDIWEKKAMSLYAGEGYCSIFGVILIKLFSEDMRGITYDNNKFLVDL
jgi:hypothetical protein